MKTNERLYKLQRQLDERKQKAKSKEKELTDDFNSRLQAMREKSEREMRDLENLTRVCSLGLEKQQAVMEGVTERLSNDIEML